MRYENSLTSNVQNYIAESLAKKVQAAQSGWELGNVAKDIRSYLCDQSSLSTPDFVIRRFLQTKQSAILPTGLNIPNLLENKNIPWPVDVLKTLAATLASRSVESGTKIEKKSWLNYLSGQRNPQNREMVYRIAFTVDMDIETTIDLLLASDMEAFSVRYPLDLCVLFCLRTPGKYTWSEALGMVEDFTQKRNDKGAVDEVPTDGMTRQIASDLDAIFAQNLPDADAKQSLVDYMVVHSGEFVNFGTTHDPKYLPGYSLSRQENFIRLLDYLAVFFPDYSWTEELTPSENSKNIEGKQWGPGKTVFETIKYRSDGTPALPTLVRSMFFNSEWKDIIWSDDFGTVSTNEFESSMRKLCQNYEQQMMKVERLRNGGKNVAFFRRQDALLFIYFFIIGYRKLLHKAGNPATKNLSRPKPNTNGKRSVELYPTPIENINLINSMCMSGDPFDDAISEVLSNIDYVFSDPDDTEAVAERFDSIKDSFNLVLAQMDYMNVYLPARFDRFIILSLLSASPSELTPLIMCQSELDFYEKSI